MKTILDAFIEISNSKESIEMIFNNYMIKSQRNFKNLLIEHNKLKSILKQNTKKALIKKYQKMSGDTFIVLVKGIAQESLEKYKNPDDVLGFLASKNNGDLINLQKLCVAIVNYQNEINNHLDLIIENHNEGRYLFEGIEMFSINECIEINNDIEKEVNKIKKSMDEMKKRLELLTQETNKFKLDNKELLDENRNLKKEIRKKIKDINKGDRENDILNKKVLNLNKVSILKDEEILKLKNEIKTKENILKEAIILDEFAIPKDIEQNICIIHTSELLMVNKIHYDVRFTRYNSVYKEIKNYIKKLRLDGIYKVGIQSNAINSFKLQEIIEIGKEENIKIYRLFFNTEKELSEKIITLK